MAQHDEPKNQNELDEFEALLRQEGSGPQRRYQPGDRVSGRVVYLGEKTATLDLGGGREALLDLAGVRNKDGQVTIRVGDVLDVGVLRVQGRTIEVAKQLGKGQLDLDALRDAAESGLPVEGSVTAVNKGGYVVDLGGGVSGFCPLGHMDIRRVEDTQAFVGQKLQFQVLEIRGGRDVVLSRRNYLEQESQRKAEETRKSLQVGMRVAGTVTNVRDFGAFVDIGGLEGLVPASELAWGKVKVADMVQIGQRVEVEVMRIEAGLDGKGRPVEKITLSMRALAQDPFDTLAPHLQPGVVLRGKVTRIEPFGAFVELVPGVEGLIHVSAFGKRIARVGEVVLPQQDVAVRVLAADPAQRRISLAWIDPHKLDELVEPAPAPAGTSARFLGRAKVSEATPAQIAESLANAPSAPRPAAVAPPSLGQVVEATVDKVEPYGVFVKFAGGRGLIPNSDLGLPHGADVRRQVPVGTTFPAVVMEVRADGKIRLSRTAAEAANERAEAQAWLSAQQKPAQSGKSVGSLGELLMAKLQESKQKR